MTKITTPAVGMEFDSVDEAWEFWLGYGKEIGFGVRKQYFNRKKDGSIRSGRFVCCKEVSWRCRRSGSKKGESSKVRG
jgi:hypothetical protein